MLAFPLRKGDADRSGWGMRRRRSVWTRLLSSFAEEKRQGGWRRLRRDGAGVCVHVPTGVGLPRRAVWACRGHILGERAACRTLGSEGGQGHGGRLGTQPDPMSSALAPPVPLTAPEGLSLPLKGSSCSE